MPNNWKTYKLGELSTLGDGAHSKVKRIDYGILYLTSKNFKDGRLKLDKIDYISENDYNRLFSSKSKAVNKPSVGDVLIGIIGTLGNAYLYKENDTFGISSSVAIIRPDHTKLDSQYLYYCITESKFKNYQNAHNGASVQGYTNLPSLRTIPINLPPLREQQAIASSLSTIDDKIENNLAINKTLEEMAMTLYKYWFVDFGPFQDSEFVESELGMIPKGWEVLSLQDVSTLTAGGDKPKKHSKEKTEECSTPIYSNGITNEGLFGFTDKARINEESITVSARGTIGYVCLRSQPYLPIVRLIAVVPNKKLTSCKYLFFWLINQNISGNGTTQQQLTVPDFKSVKVLIPQIELINAFTEIVNPYYEKINFNKIENQSLTQLRETLLPQLISGTVQLKEFQETVEEVV